MLGVEDGKGAPCKPSAYVDRRTCSQRTRQDQPTKKMAKVEVGKHVQAEQARAGVCLPTRPLGGSIRHLPSTPTCRPPRALELQGYPGPEEAAVQLVAEEVDTTASVPGSTWITSVPCCVRAVAPDTTQDAPCPPSRGLPRRGSGFLHAQAPCQQPQAWGVEALSSPGSEVSPHQLGQTTSEKGMRRC